MKSERLKNTPSWDVGSKIFSLVNLLIFADYGDFSPAPCPPCLFFTLAPEHTTCLVGIPPPPAHVQLNWNIDWFHVLQHQKHFFTPYPESLRVYTAVIMDILKYEYIIRSETKACLNGSQGSWLRLEVCDAHGGTETLTWVLRDVFTAFVHP